MLWIGFEQTEVKQHHHKGINVIVGSFYWHLQSPVIFAEPRPKNCLSCDQPRQVLLVRIYLQSITTGARRSPSQHSSVAPPPPTLSALLGKTLSSSHKPVRESRASKTLAVTAYDCDRNAVICATVCSLSHFPVRTQTTRVVAA